MSEGKTDNRKIKTAARAIGAAAAATTLGALAVNTAVQIASRVETQRATRIENIVDYLGRDSNASFKTMFEELSRSLLEAKNANFALPENVDSIHFLVSAQSKTLDVTISGGSISVDQNFKRVNPEKITQALLDIENMEDTDHFWVDIHYKQKPYEVPLAPSQFPDVQVDWSQDFTAAKYKQVILDQTGGSQPQKSITEGIELFGVDSTDHLNFRNHTVERQQSIGWFPSSFASDVTSMTTQISRDMEPNHITRMIKAYDVK